MVFDVSLEMQSDSKNYVRVQDKIGMRLARLHRPLTERFLR